MKKSDFNDNGGLYRRFQTADTGPGTRISVVANFDVVPQTRSIAFQTTGTWHNYPGNGTGPGINGTAGDTFNLASPTQAFVLQPGEYHVYIFQPSNIRTFIGSGIRTGASNPAYKKAPLSLLPAGSEIYVNPRSGGECILNRPQGMASDTKLTVAAGKNSQYHSISLTIKYAV